jgi:hypothetical protein
MKCAAKETEVAGKGVECATRVAMKMTKNYRTKLQSKCGDASCLASYPATNPNTCLDLIASLSSSSAQNLFGFMAAPADPVTVNGIGFVANPGCTY